MDHSLEAEIEQRVDALGFELVEMERAGSARRPILRLRIDRPQEGSVSDVTLDDCTRVSRALEAWLDERPGLAPSYVLEVSSPGVERPLVRPRDFRRFAGQPVALLGKAALAGRAKRLEGELLGLLDEGGAEEAVRLRLKDGEEVTVSRSEISRAHLVFRWGSEGRRS
jgi:ribosome maturation factor RimP